MAEFADRVTLQVQAGHGGNGCASIHREKFKPLGGPDGGNGGRGGDVILEVDASSATLLDFHRRPVRRAGNGRQGEGSNRTGADGADLIIASAERDRGQDGRRRGARRPGRRGHPVRRRRGRPGRARQRGAGLAAAQGARVRPQGRAGSAARPHPRAEDGRRRRAGRLPQRGQVLPDRGDVRGPAEDRRLPVHHLDPEPRRGRGGRRPVRRGRRAGPDPGRQPGQGPGPRLPPARGALLHPGPRHRLRDRGTRPRPGRRPGRDRGGTDRLRRDEGGWGGGWGRTRQAAAADRAQQDRRAGRPRAGGRR